MRSSFIRPRSKSRKSRTVLNPGIYFIIDPTYFDDTKIGYLFKPYIDIDKIGNKGKLITYNGYTMFLFKTKFGAGGSPLNIDNKYIGNVDSDHGSLLVIPRDLVIEINNPFITWVTQTTYGTIIGAFIIEIPCKPIVKNGKLTIDNDIVLDTSDLSHKTEAEKKFIKKFNGQKINQN